MFNIQRPRQKEPALVLFHIYILLLWVFDNHQGIFAYLINKITLLILRDNH